MEIKRFMTEFKQNNPEKFFDWAADGRIMEIRFLSDCYGNKFDNWDLIKELASKLDCETRFSSIYISNWEQLRKILLARTDNSILTKAYNIFMSVNPKRKVCVKNKNGLIYQSYYGGIAGIERVQNVLCDIEYKDRTSASATESELQDCINGAEYLIEQLELDNFYINISGNGTHLWIKLNEAIELPIPDFTEYDDKIKYRLKEDPIYTHIKTYNRFIEKLNRMLQKYNSKLIVDEGAKDISRIARPPGSWNIKVGKTARAVGTIIKGCYTEDKDKLFNKYINLKYMAAKPILSQKTRKIQEKVSLSSKYRYNHLSISESPLVKFLLSKYLPSTLSRNHYLERSLARLIRDNNICIEDIQKLIGEIDIVQRKTIQCDPEYLEDDEPFNPEMINSYCVGNKIDLLYPILDLVPNVKEGFISEEHYQNLNSYSLSTIQKLSPKIPGNIDLDYYIDLKRMIRILVDLYPKSEVFYFIKSRLIKVWDYYDKNRIILQLLNKTRRRNNER